MSYKIRRSSRNIIKENLKKIKEAELAENQNKSDIINSLNKPHAVFIDDSFKERKDVFLNCNIPCLTPEETQYLI